MHQQSTHKNDILSTSKRPENTAILRPLFTGKEKDSETGYYYFGARYYNSDLSLWLSVDPMSDKYPSLSPYNYCAWNPMKIVDPDGNKIWIVGNDGNNYQYKRGKMYTVNGDIYKGNDSYVTRVCSDLSELKTLGVRKEIKRMEHSKLDITIRNDNDNSQCSLDDVGEVNPSIGSGSIITYNSKKTETKDGVRDPVYGLAHELGHAYDAMNGKTNDKKVSIFKKGENYTDKEIPISEINAVRFENRVRPPDRQRTTYDGYDLTPFNVIMKDENGMGL